MEKEALRDGSKRIGQAEKGHWSRKSTEPKTYQNETPIWLKEKVVAIRKKTKKCALKIHWQLEKEGNDVDTRTIGKILKREGLVRKYRARKVKYKYLRAERKPGELIEIDVKYVPGSVENKRYYQYTAVDTASRWRYLAVYDGQSSFHSIRFLKEVMKRFPHRLFAIKTDNHSTFTNLYTGANKRSDLTVKTIHPLDVFCAKNSIDSGKVMPAARARARCTDRKLFALYSIGMSAGFAPLNILSAMTADCRPEPAVPSE